MDTIVTKAYSQDPGKRLSLDFANTADWHAGDQPVESLTSYAALVAWSREAGLLTAPLAQRLLDEAAHRPAVAAAVLERAISLREAIYRLLSAISHGQPPSDTALAAFNTELPGVLARSQVVRTDEGFAWERTGDEEALDRMLWPIVHDALSLLSTEQLDRVGQCAADECGWLFLDMSRNRSRRWCSMDDCGNRAKARRHYRRSRDPQET